MFGFRRGYLYWKDHGEVHEAAPLGNRQEDEGIYQHDMHGLLNDLFSTLPMEGNNADTSEGEENTSLNTKPGWMYQGSICYAQLCAYDNTSKWLDHGKNSGVFWGHRRWLEHVSLLRMRTLGSFDGPWKKKSIFFELPYWKSLLLPHNLDVMHIEKNLNERKLIGMKSYDYHMLMQEYLPIALRGTLLDHVSTVVIETQNYHIKGKHRSRRIPQFELEKIHCEQFSEWFRKRVERLEELNDPRVTQEIKWLARGPNNFVRRYSGYFVKGYHFHTNNHENSLKSQNSGVVVTVLDSSNTQEVVSYYGSLKEVVKLNYSGKLRVVLFKCDWVDVNKGCKRDKFGITLVNFSYLTHSGSDIHDDPFVFASQVDKVFYAKDPRLEGWLVVRHVKVKDAFNMGCNSDQNSLYSIPDTCDVPSLHRNEVDGDDEIDVTESMEDEEEEDEEEEDTY
ncbi:ribonuclease H-like domain-containing protein [Tanacetum coccineum]